MPSALRLLAQADRLAISIPFIEAGTMMADSMAMMAMTTNSSISVNADRAFLRQGVFDRLGFGWQASSSIRVKAELDFMVLVFREV